MESYQLPLDVICDLNIVAMISGCSEDEILKCSKRIIKHALGKDVYKRFTF